MIDKLTGSAVIFAVAFSIAIGAPARPLYEPPDPHKPVPAVLFVGTTWVGRLFTDNEQVTFHANGTLTYQFGQDGRDRGSPGTWKLTGNQLWFEVNKYSEYQTTITADTIQGIGWNREGQKVKPLLKRSRIAVPALGPLP